ncbi:MFS transporter (plasmid) [Paraburkholderia sp. PREW-6R]|uniref:MFS transporter n=1 Tax=Paraburkholderia sp. PREW-6R TaxID=3141544 RepID=UPI0031F4AFF9
MSSLSRWRRNERSACSARAVAVVAGAGLNMLVNTGPVLLFSFGVFVKPIVADTGWSRTSISSAVLYGQVLLALCGPLTGFAVDRFGARQVARFAGPLLGLGLAMVGLLSNSANSFVLFFALSFLLGAAQVPVTYVKAVAGWYDAHLGIALGFALMLSGLGVAVLPPLSAALIEAVGWRTAYLSLAGFVWLVSVPSVQWLLHEPPREARLGAAAVHATARADVLEAPSGVTLRAALRTRAFWLMALGFFLISVVVGAGTWVLPVVLSDYGLKAQQGAFVMTIVGAAMMVGRLGFGALLDRFFAPRITAAVFVGAALGYLCLVAGISAWTVPVAAILIGFTLGSEVDALAYMASRIFGRRHLGAIYGSLMFCFSVGLGCGPALFAQLYDRTGGYQAAFWAAALFALIAALAVCGLRERDLRFGA